MTTSEFKEEIVEAHLFPLEERLLEIWPGGKPLITLLVRTPWLPDGGILITNDSTEAARAEFDRLSRKGKIG